MEEEPYLERDYMSSYIYGGESPIGSVTSVWWFKPDDIEPLVQIENEHQVRVFPRYFHKMSWHEKYNLFCWSYKLYQEYLAGLKEAASDNFNLLREYARQNDINLDKLLDDNPGIIKIETVEYIEQQAQQSAANNVKAVSEFLDLLVNFDPSPWDVPGAMSDLKCRYLKQLDGILDRVAMEEAKYAFYAEGPTWTITFNGNTTRGLKQRGFKYIEYLTRNQHKEFHTDYLSELDGIDPVDDGYENVDFSRSVSKAKDGKIIDKRTKEEYDKHLKQLQENLHDAEQSTDPLIRLEAEKALEDFLKEYEKAIV